MKEKIRNLIPRGIVHFLDDGTMERSEFLSYGTDATGLEPRFSVLAFPSSTEEVASLVRFANENRITIVPSGGRTGYSGGAVATDDEIVVSTRNMGRIAGFDPFNRTVHCEAGVTTAKLQEYALSVGGYFPIDLPSAGSSTIGGNLATNAGGLHVIRYGMMRRWCAGIVAVTGNGTILRSRTGIKKENSGFDCKELLIGSEGSLAFITEAYLELTDPPKETKLLFFILDRFAPLLEVRKETTGTLLIHSFEFFDDASLETLCRFDDRFTPFAAKGKWYLLVEYEAPLEEPLPLFERLGSLPGVVDILSVEATQKRRHLWSYRETISEAIGKSYRVYKGDISLPLWSMEPFLAKLNELLSRFDGIRHLLFGHAGDGNLHLNLTADQSVDKREFDDRIERIKPELFALVERHGGAPSAEHGIGLLKTDLLPFAKSDEEIALMRRIKAAFDPNGILNPGKVLEMELSE